MGPFPFRRMVCPLSSLPRLKCPKPCVKTQDKFQLYLEVPRKTVPQFSIKNGGERNEKEHLKAPLYTRRRFLDTPLDAPKRRSSVIFIEELEYRTKWHSSVGIFFLFYFILIFSYMLLYSLVKSPQGS